MIARSAEFENVAVREDELPELDALLLSKDNPVPFDVRGGVENKIGKVNALMQVDPVCACQPYAHTRG